jgi:hypothetical protein
MNLKKEIERTIAKKARTFNPENNKVYMENDTADVVINKVLDAAVEALLKYEGRDSKMNHIQAINKLRGK